MSSGVDGAAVLEADTPDEEARVVSSASSTQFGNVDITIGTREGGDDGESPSRRALSGGMSEGNSKSAMLTEDDDPMS